MSQTVELIKCNKVFDGEQRKYRHYSDTLKSEMTFSLYLPASEEPLPLVWWLSGLTCNDDNFSQKGGFQKYAAELGLAVVMPDTSPRGESVADSQDWDLGQGAGFYLDATEEPWRENYQMASYILGELSQIVKSLIPDFSGKEAVMGHSMGGHGALVLGLKAEERFSSISAFAPILTPSDVPWGQKAFRHYLGQDEKKWQEWDATALLSQTEKAPAILVSQGDQDEFLTEQLVSTKFLTVSENQPEVRYELQSGYDHSYYFIATFIEEHLKFHYQHLTN
ncbi:S-formylglutathione hydrolase [Vagococcus allomyrinae]|uniref:S-formylglutathione hydrolase n=1 Tax=Vagococcus allomyrinae TaxID=2794353 RepID=UPI001FD7E92C|nr:S-formylglutathione hydrolase [Vagococcus allomyrinae]